MKVTLLGSGSAYRTPALGGHWGKCDPQNPKNRRLCQSILLEHQGKKVVIDTGPDFREQSIKYKISNIEAVILTHAHYDHYFGLPELEVLSLLQKRSIPVYAHPTTWTDVKPTMHWLLDSSDPHHPPILQAHDFAYGETLSLAGLDFLPMQQHHGIIDSTGFRIGNFAYSTDLNAMPDESFAALEGIDTWILECDSIEPSRQHNNLEQALAWINKLNPARTYLTHIHPFVDHDHLSKMLPENVAVAYDGLEIEVDISN